MLEKHKIPIAISVLITATVAVFDPLLAILVVLFISFVGIIFHSTNFGLAAAIAATLFGEFGRVEILGNSVLALDLVVPIVLIVWLSKKIIKKEPLQFDQTGRTLLIFWGIAFLSLLLGGAGLAKNEFRFAALHLIRFIAISGLFFVARDQASSKSDTIIKTLLASGVMLAISGFYLLTIFPDFAEAGLADLGWDPHIGRLTSTWLDPNFVAGAFAFLLALTGGKFLSTKKIASQFLLIVVAGVLLAALLLTFSRSGLLALGISGLVLGIIKSRKLLIALLLVGILGIFVSERLSERVDELSQSASALGSESQQVLDPTAQLRVESWKEGLRIWNENPVLGTGYGTYKFHQTFSDEESHAATGSDSSLLNIGATTGIIGFLAFIMFLINLVRDAWEARKTPLGLGFLAGTAGLLIHSIFVNSLLFPPLLLYLLISGGLLRNTTP